jgi:ABC-type uncharacterized transport system substrate-binding protein
VQELVSLAPDVILAHGTSTVGPLLQATRTIPIVFPVVVDPIGAGFVESLARPGGNATGFMAFEYSLGGKWLELLKEIAPNVTRVGIFRDPANLSGTAQFGVIQTAAPSHRVEVNAMNMRDAGEIERAVAALARAPNGGLILTGSGLANLHSRLIIKLAARHNLPAIYYEGSHVAAGGLSQIKDVEPAAAAIRRHVEVVKATTAREIEAAFEGMVQNRLEAVVIGADPLFFDRLVLIAMLAARYALPAITGAREFVDAGGLMSYGASNLERYRQVGIYTGRILKGEKPADMSGTWVTARYRCRYIAQESRWDPRRELRASAFGRGL